MPLPPDPLKWAVTAFKDGRNDDYARYQQYLDGIQPLAFATEKFRSAFGRIFDAFAYNRCDAVVGAHADRLQIAGFGADDGDLAQTAQVQWDANRMDVREGHIETDAFGLGQSYLLVEKHPITGKVHYWVQNPANIRMHWSDDAPDALDLAVKTWQTDDGHQRINLYYADKIQKYISANRAPSGMPASPAAFTRYDRDGEPWEFTLNVTDTVPVFAFANNGRTNSYGVSELRHVLPLQDALNKTVMDTLVAMEFAAYPQRVVTGLQDAPDDDTKGSITRFEAGISRILTLYGGANIAEFSAANIGQYIAIAEFFDLAIARVTKTPVHHLTMVGDFPSGAALRIAEAPFTKKLVDRQRERGSVFSSAVSYGLRLDAIDVAPGALRINWEPAAPVSEEDVWDLIASKVSAGMPFVAALREAGYDKAQIRVIAKEANTQIRQAERLFDAGMILDEQRDRRIRDEERTEAA